MPLSSSGLGRPAAITLALTAVLACSWPAHATAGFLLVSSAAAFPALVGVSIPTMIWRSCTLPELIQGYASDHSLLQ